MAFVIVNLGFKSTKTAEWPKDGALVMHFSSIGAPMLCQQMPNQFFFLSSKELLRVAHTTMGTMMCVCEQLFALSAKLHICLCCRTLGNDVFPWCNLCHMPMCRPGSEMPCFDLPRWELTTFEEDLTVIRQRVDITRGAMASPSAHTVAPLLDND